MAKKVKSPSKKEQEKFQKFILSTKRPNKTVSLIFTRIISIILVIREF